MSGHRAAQISAMGRKEADSWVGKVAHYTKKQASFDGNSCESPVYEVHALQAEDFYSRFKIAPEALEYKHGPIEIIEVYCGNGRWVNPGGTLIRMGSDKLFVIWDGVFFRLQERQRQ